MKQFQILFISLAFCTAGISQSSIGVEIRTSRNITYNSSLIEGGSFGYSGYEVTKEGDPKTSTYSIGFTYSPNLVSTFKLHIGMHQNGRILDLTEYDDTFSSFSYENVDLPYNYLQLVPTYAYNFRKGRINIPIEVGFSINKRIKEEDIFYVGITEYNYDFRLSSGIQYDLDNFRIGSNIVYSKSIGNYETKNVTGEYKPYQIGIELGIGYTISKEKENTITNRVDGSAPK